MLTESCCFLSLEVESCVQTATKKPVWEGMQGACAMQEGSNVEQAFLGARYAAESGSCPDCATNSLIVLGRRLLLPCASSPSKKEE